MRKKVTPVTRRVRTKVTADAIREAVEESITKARRARKKVGVAASEAHKVIVGENNATLVERAFKASQRAYDFARLRVGSQVGMLVPWSQELAEQLRDVPVDQLPEDVKKARLKFRQKVGLAAYHFGRKTGAKMHVETHDDGVMVWRVE